jgi:CheY-like chemotaxis protein
MRWTFLIVDANDRDATVTTQHLQRVMPGAEILRATTGEAAIALLEEARLVPSMIFLDFALPSMNGIEFLGNVRQRRWLERVPVTLLSEPVDDRLVVTCYRLGAAAFLTKPVRVHELREAVRDFATPAERLSVATTIPGMPSPISKSAA